jgi:aminopeptidase-like protein
MHRLIEQLHPICRSITGNGLRMTLAVVGQELAQEAIALEVHEVPTGTAVYDWTVPREWNIRDAYVKNSSGERIIDFRRSPLHVVGYSTPVDASLSLPELRPHLYSDERHPDWIPYRTSYYQENWGFCLPHRQLASLPDDTYQVRIDSELSDGHLTYGEALLPGEIADEVLISCHACHPALCNDNLSGIATAVFLARALQQRRRRYSYRFLFVPGLIGTITWLARNDPAWHRVKHGLVLACIGDSGRSTYKRTRHEDAEIDHVVEHVLRMSGQDYGILEFSPFGYDERQYASPGIDLPVGCLMRTPFAQFPEYHTSADDLDLVRPDALADSLRKCLSIAEVLDGNGRYINLSPKCEPQLGRRGLYASIGGASQHQVHQLAMLWVLNLSDGRHTLLDIADRAKLDFATIRRAADALRAVSLLEDAPASSLRPAPQR